MITRRRSRTVNNTQEQPLQVEVIDVVEDVPRPSEGYPADDLDSAGVALDDLFEDLKWTMERDASSPLFDIDLADLGVYSARDQDSGLEVSTSSSPERMSSDSRMKDRQSASVINKNAIAARLNRLKKKEYVSSLEKRVSILSTENFELKKENTQLSKRVEELEDETRGPTQMTTTMRCRGSA